MCGRTKLDATWREIWELYQLTAPNQVALNLEPRFNIAPMQPVPVIRMDQEGHRRCDMLRWGLVPWFCKDQKQAKVQAVKCINARAETVEKLASFKRPFASKRCLVPASGYYEWTGEKGEKQPYLITFKDGGLMTLGGLWERWTDPATKQAIETFVILTTEPSRSAARVHDRMPLILEPAQFDGWLSGPAEIAMPMLKPWPGELTIVPVNRAMNHWKNDKPEDAAPIGEPLADEAPPILAQA